MPTESSLKRLAAAKEKKAAKADEYREAKKIARKNLRPRPELARPATKAQKASVVPEILARVDSGWHLVRALEDVPGAPNKLMWYNWLRRDPELNQQYQEARQRGYLALADELHEIADTPHLGETRTDTSDMNGGSTKVVTEDMLGHRNLQVSTRKWLLSKMIPKMFGDRILQEVSGPDGSPVKISNVDLKGLTDEELETMQRLMLKAAGAV
jgi:hypothetical protein